MRSERRDAAIFCRSICGIRRRKAVARSRLQIPDGVPITVVVVRARLNRTDTNQKATMSMSIHSISGISSAGKSSSITSSAAQEATETPAQTAKEARQGDRQALRLEAKREAASKAASSAQSTPPANNSSGQTIGSKINTTA